MSPLHLKNSASSGVLAIDAPPHSVAEGGISALIFSDAAVQVIINAVDKAQQSEICGFLLGYTIGNRLHIQAARPAENIYHSKTAFAISPKEYAAALADTTRERAVVGIYHHHYGSARPSRADRKSMMLQPLVWLIIGLLDEGPRPILEWKAFAASRTGIRRLGLEFNG